MLILEKDRDLLKQLQTILVLTLKAVNTVIQICLYFSAWDLLNKSRSQDIQLLKTLRVKYIFDLMLENKKVKYGMRWVLFDMYTHIIWLFQ